MIGSITVRVPATTANLGPGFDALGLALARYNTVTVEPASSLHVEITGHGADSLPRDARNVIVRAIERGCRVAGTAMPPLHLVCDHAIPPARGLGSSAAAVVAGLMIADAIAGGALGRERLLAIATDIEGHPDNAAPALFGGLQCAVHAEHRVEHLTVPVARFPTVVLFVPEFPMPTREARRVLPTRVSRDDAVFNLSRTALLVTALVRGEFELLGLATEDRLHQVPREAVFPAMPKLFRAARDAGAYATWLSGAGSTIAAFVADDRADDVARAMSVAAAAEGVKGVSDVTTVDDTGATCVPRSIIPPPVTHESKRGVR